MTVSHASKAQVVTSGIRPDISARQRNEHAHIRQGVTTDELTRTEAARLRGREANIRTDRRAAHVAGRGDPRRASGHPQG